MPQYLLSRGRITVDQQRISDGHPDLGGGSLIDKDLAAFDLQLYIFGGIFRRTAILPQHLQLRSGCQSFLMEIEDQRLFILHHFGNTKDFRGASSLNTGETYGMMIFEIIACAGHLTGDGIAMRAGCWMIQAGNDPRL